MKTLSQQKNNKIYLNIRGIKNYEDNELEDLDKALAEIQVPFASVLYGPFREIIRKVSYEKRKRKTSKKVWVRFTCSWSGYSNNPSAPRRTLGAEYRKLGREIAEKLPNYFCHRFDDGSTNDWNISVVSVRGKEKGSSYSQQVDRFLENQK